MASPSAMSTSSDNVATGDIAFQFCKNCSNLLHPSEDKANKKLRYRCRTCYYSEEAKALCIHRRVYAQNAGATAGVTQDVGEDPALERSNKECPACHETDAVTFQSQQRHKDTGMELFFVCCSCGKIYH